MNQNELRYKNKKLVEERNTQVVKNNKQSRIKSLHLQISASFGIQSMPIYHQLHICGRDQIVFVSGNTIVIKDISDKRQYFVNKQHRFKHVTAMQAFLKQNTKKYPGQHPIQLFIGQSSLSQQQPAYVFIDDYQISIYKTVKNKMRLINTQKKGIIKQLFVHIQRKQICAVINSTQVLHLVLYNYKKNRLVASCILKPGFQKVTLHPVQQYRKHIYIMSHNNFRLWQVNMQEQIIKQSHQSIISLSIEKEHKFNDHCWTTLNKAPALLILVFHIESQSNKIILMQSNNIFRIFPIEITSLKNIKDKVKTQNTEQDVYNMNMIQFTAITPTKKGFVLGGGNKLLALYQFQKNFNILNSQTITSNDSINQEEKIIKIFVSANDQILTFYTINQVGLSNFYIVNLYQLDTQFSSIQKFFSAGFHTKKVHAISRSITKNLIASCSQDNTIKIWNFYQSQSTYKKGILSQSFTDEPISISIHPSGLFIAIGFNTGFKIFCIVSNSIVMLKETQLPNCQQVRYCNGGHYLVVTQKQHIFVYDSIYYETIHLFSLTSNVQDISISDDDLFIVATCHTGYVFCFSLLETTRSNYQSKKPFDHQQPSIYNCIAYDSKIVLNQKDQKNQNIVTDLFVGSSIEKFLCIYKNKCKNLVVQFPVVDCYVTSLLISSKLGVLFVGTSVGTIRIYTWPILDSNLEWEMVGNNEVKFKHPEFNKINVHAGSITCLCLSYDCEYLFSGCEDGTIMCIKIKEIYSEDEKKQKLAKNEEDQERITQTANDLYLQKVSKIQQKNEMIQKLKNQVIRSEQKLKMQKEKLQMMFKQKLDNLKKEFNLNLESDRKMKESYIEASQKDYQEGLLKLESAKKFYQMEIEKVKEEHQKKIMYEENRNNKLEQQIEELKEKHKRDLEILKQQHKQKLKQNKKSFFEKCQKLQIKYSNIIDVSKRNAHDFIRELDQKDKQYQQEIQKQIKQKKQEIQKIQSINEQLKDKNIQLEKEYNQLKRQDQLLQNQFEQKFKQHNNIRFQNLKNDQDILKMQHQLLQRLQVIDSKEETCKNARYQQTTLENFRFMLDQKIESLQQKKKEMLQKIKEKQNDLKNMFSQLIKESQQNQKKYRELKMLMSQIQVLQSDIKKSQNQITFNKNKLNHFQNQLSNIVKSSDDTKTIARKLNDLLDDKNQKIDNTKIMKEDKGGSLVIAQHSQQQVNQQLERQGKWMNKKIQLIKVTSQRFKELRENNINQTINQNVKLIEECTQLRKENQKVKKEISDLQKKLNQHIRKKQRGDFKKKEDNLKNLNKKVKEQQSKINLQQAKLTNIKQQIKDVLSKQKEKKLPPINESNLGNYQRREQSQILKGLEDSESF